MRPEGAFLRVRDLRSGTDYLWAVELFLEVEAKAAARREAEHKAEREAALRKALDVRIAALEARLGRGGQQPTDGG